MGTVQMSKVNNKLENVHVNRDYIGSQSLNVDAEALKEFRKNEVMLKQAELFAENARNYIMKLIEDIQDSIDFEYLPSDLSFEKLKNKFENMKCSESYIASYKKHSQYFHYYDSIKEESQTQTLENPLERVENYILKLYMVFFEQFETGDLIHNAIFAEIINCEYNDKLEFSADCLIFFTIKECGIFNETK